MLVVFCWTSGAMITLCSAVFLCSDLHMMLYSLSFALVPPELKAAIHIQLPQKTPVHWASKGAASPLTFRSYKAIWQHLLPPAMCSGDGSDGKGILYAEEFINMRIHIFWLVINQSASTADNWVAEDKKISGFNCCSPCWCLVWFFPLNFIEQHVNTFCWLIVSTEGRPSSPLRNSADSLEWVRRMLQVQKEAIEAANLV